MQVNDFKECKMSLRKHYKNLRISMKSKYKEKLDSQIYSRVISLTEYKNCRALLTYVSKAIEVDTLKIIKRAFIDNKIVAVPKCIPNQKGMEFYIIKSFNDLRSGTFGILEPNESKCIILNDYNDSLCIVPGLSFDHMGHRLGYGQGYYDRFLNDFCGITAGLCYSHCIREKLPCGNFDKPVNLLVTDKYIMNIRRTINER